MSVRLIRAVSGDREVQRWSMMMQRCVGEVDGMLGIFDRETDSEKSGQEGEFRAQSSLTSHVNMAVRRARDGDDYSTLTHHTDDLGHAV